MTGIRPRPGDGTGGLRTGAAAFESLHERAVTLRREGLNRREIRDHLAVHNNDILNRLLAGEPPPEWTKHPNTKDDLRDGARELRLHGLPYDQIQDELGCSNNVGDTHRGRLAVRVLKGSDLYRRIEGAWCGIVGAVG